MVIYKCQEGNRLANTKERRRAHGKAAKKQPGEDAENHSPGYRNHKPGELHNQSDSETDSVSQASRGRRKLPHGLILLAFYAFVKWEETDMAEIILDIAAIALSIFTIAYVLTHWKERK